MTNNDSNHRETHTQRGPVEATVRLSPARSKIGDPVTLTIEVKAAPSVELLLPTFGESLERFVILDFVPRESIDREGNSVAVHTYRLQTATSGEHTIPPIIIEFVDRRAGQRPTPEDEDAFELLTDPLVFIVESVIPDDATGVLHPAMGRLMEPIGARHTHWITGGAALLFGLAALLWWMRRRLSSVSEVRDAYEIAASRLQALRAEDRPQVGDRMAMDKFFVEISDIVRRYVESRFGLHAPELTTEEFLDAAVTSPDLHADQRTFLQIFLQRADQVKFAGHSPQASDVEGALGSVQQFLDQTREMDEGSDPVEALARA